MDYPEVLSLSMVALAAKLSRDDDISIALCISTTVLSHPSNAYPKRAPGNDLRPTRSHAPRGYDYAPVDGTPHHQLPLSTRLQALLSLQALPFLPNCYV